MSPLDPTFELLVSHYIEGRLSPQEESALQERLQVDGQARSRFVAILDLHSMLASDRALVGGMLAAVDVRIAEQERKAAQLLPFKGRVVGWWCAVACVLLATFGLVNVVVWRLARPQVLIVGGVGQRFTASEPPPGNGELIGRSFDLSAGLVELFFRKSDATVVIEAPARFRIEDAKTLRMESGRLSAVVRNGKQGLRVLTPHTEVLDLGTRFAVDATQTSRSEVHVFEGKVQAGSVAHASQSHLLEASGALRFDGAPQPMPCDLREAAFVQSEELIPLAAALRARQDERATQAFKRLQADPALLAATNFEKTENDKLLTVNGPRRVQGRFPGVTRWILWTPMIT